MSSGKTTPGDPATRRRILDSALKLIVKRGGADLTLAEVARAARVSRQAIYLHFADRAELFIAVARHIDDLRGIPAAIQRIAGAPTGVAAIRVAVSMQARMNPDVWPVARALDAVRRLDEAAERSWQDRLDARLHGCRAIVSRLEQEGSLRPDLTVTVAADLLWTLISLRMWEHLVLQRGWTAADYEQRIGDLAVATLTRG